MKCSECGHALKGDGEEGEAPLYRTGDTGTPDDVLCDDCYDKAGLEFECCLCCDWEHEAYQDRLGDLFIVAEPVPLDAWPEKNVEPGTYEIVKHPYYGGPLIGEGYFFDGTLRRVGDLPSQVYMNGYPTGHCCRDCKVEAKGATR